MYQTTNERGETVLQETKMCDTCRCDSRDYEYTCGRRECVVCADDRQLADPIYNRSTIINIVAGASSELSGQAKPHTLNSRALYRRRVWSGSIPWTDIPERMRAAWLINCEQDHVAVFEVVQERPHRRSAHRTFYAVLPNQQTRMLWDAPDPHIVLLGDEQESAYAVAQWAIGLLTVKELLYGVYRVLHQDA